QVQDDRQVVVERGLPGRRAYLSFAHAEVLVPVQVERDRLSRGVRPVEDHRVGVVAALASAAPGKTAADAVGLVARTTWVGAAVNSAGQLGECVDIFHDVDLSVLRPLARAEHPERGPVAEPAAWLLDR